MLAVGWPAEQTSPLLGLHFSSTHGTAAKLGTGQPQGAELGTAGEARRARSTFALEDMLQIPGRSLWIFVVFSSPCDN